MKLSSKSIADTEAFAAEFFKGLSPKKAGATIIGLYGNLGSGKTTFVQALARTLGIKEIVTSPTFVIEKIYPIIQSLSTPDSQFFTHLIHIDAYRLESSNEMKHIGWDAIVRDPANLIVIEWPERLTDLLPPDHARLHFAFIDETTREIEIK